MQKAELLKFHETACARMRKICEQKNADYTGAADGDVFANFSRVEAIGVASTEVGFVTRMTDKLCRIASFVKQGSLQVKDESVEDTLLDLANYCILLAAYVKSRRAHKEVKRGRKPGRRTGVRKAAGAEDGVRSSGGDESGQDAAG